MLPIPPKVSVIVPNYNHELYLRRRIDSIVNQLFTDFELIILDDCSLDNSRGIITEYAAHDERITVVFNEKNSGGVFRQWQRGLTLARGQYIWIAESDDFAEPGFLTEMVLLLDQDKEIGFAYANSWIVDESDAAHGTTADWKNTYFGDNHWCKDYIADGQQELRRYLAVACTVNNASAVLFRRSSIIAAGGIDASFRYTGDWLMYIKLSLRGRVAYRAACLSNYREHAANASKRSLVDGSQLFERLKCYAFLHQSGALDGRAQSALLVQASQEYLTLQYELLRVRREPFRLLSYIHGIAKVDFLFYVRIQIKSATLIFRSKA